MNFTKEDTLKSKGLGIVLLIFHHLFFTKTRFGAYGVVPAFLSEDALIYVANACRICVWLFVFLSAYGLTIQLERKLQTDSDGRFVLRRWYLLMKPFWFVYLFVTSIHVLCGLSLSKYNSLANAIVDFLGVADLFGSPTLSGTWWYMSYAQIMLVLMPVLVKVCRKYGWLTLFMSFVLIQYFDSGFVSSSGGKYVMYLYGQILGILCAQNDTLGRIKKIRKLPHKVAFVLASVLTICVFVIVRFELAAQDFPYKHLGVTWLLYSFAAVIVCAIAAVVKDFGILAWLEKHSGNMFMIHMFYVYRVPDVVFYTKTVIGSFLTLFLLSILTSVLIEFVKKLVRYDAVADKLYNRVMEIFV